MSAVCNARIRATGQEDQQQEADQKIGEAQEERQGGMRFPRAATAQQAAGEANGQPVERDVDQGHKDEHHEEQCCPICSMITS